MKQNKRLSALFLLTALFVLTLCSAVFAKKIKMQTHTYWAGDPSAYTVFCDHLPESAQLVSIKSSKPKVLKAEQWGNSCWDCVVSQAKARLP